MNISTLPDRFHFQDFDKNFFSSSLNLKSSQFFDLRRDTSIFETKRGKLVVLESGDFTSPGTGGDSLAWKVAGLCALLAAEQFRFLKRLSRSLSTGLFPRSFRDPRRVAIRFLKLSPRCLAFVRVPIRGFSQRRTKVENGLGQPGRRTSRNSLAWRHRGLNSNSFSLSSPIQGESANTNAFRWSTIVDFHSWRDAFLTLRC